jgi:flagellar biosynthesis/type III secretory pathway protein FliH
LITSWLITTVNQENLTADDQELVMNLSQAYLDWREATREEARQEGLQEGRQEGRQEGQRLVVENLLRVKFGSLDAELLGVVEALLQLPPEEFAGILLQLSSLSREELLARFGNAGN